MKATQDAASVGFRTAALDVRVERTPLRLVVRDLAGNIISADAVGRPTQFQLGGFSVHKTMPGDEHYFGLGDKAGTFDRRNQAYTLWNTDIGTQESIDPIYKSIPFFLGIGGGRSYGLFLDNTWRTWFDFGKQARDAYSFGAEGGPLDYAGRSLGFQGRRPRNLNLLGCARFSEAAGLSGLAGLLLLAAESGATAQSEDLRSPQR